MIVVRPGSFGVSASCHESRPVDSTPVISRVIGTVQTTLSSGRPTTCRLAFVDQETSPGATATAIAVLISVSESVRVLA